MIDFCSDTPCIPQTPSFTFLFLHFCFVHRTDIQVEQTIERAHTRAQESIAHSVLRLAEHAGAVQAQVEVEMGALQRAGGESARQLTRELREVRDRAVAAELVSGPQCCTHTHTHTHT